MPKFRLNLLSTGVDVENLDHVELVMDVAPESYLTSTEGRTLIHAVLEGDSVSREAMKFVSSLRLHIPTFRAINAEIDLVNIHDIADLVHLNRESVRLWTTGQRGPGGFPKPFASVGAGRMKVWASSDAEAWLSAQGFPMGDARSLTVAEIVDINNALTCSEIAQATQAAVVDMAGWHSARRSAVSLTVKPFVRAEAPAISAAARAQ